MKKCVSILLCLCLLLSACAVDEPAPTDTDYTAEDIAAAVIAGVPGLTELYAVRFGDADFAGYAPLYLGDLALKCAGGVICYPFGPRASEVTVFMFASPDDAAQSAAALEAYRESRAGTFFGYAPEEAELAENGLVLTRGVFAAIIICGDTDAAKAAFDSCFGPDAPDAPALDTLVTALPGPGGDPGTATGDDPAPGADPDPGTDSDPGTDPAPGDDPDDGPGPGNEPADVPDTYDHDAVVNAWQTGDTSGLTPKNLAVYDACAQVFADIIDDGMTSFQKELAVNDWMVFNGEYDPAELESGPLGTPDPDNGNPYGFLVNGVGICLGYSSTFQLMMDLLGIECVTVHGSSHGGSEDHAWNMVKLSGDWYCVDVTWNDPVFSDWEPPEDTVRMYAHIYFNVTSDYMRSTDHQWTQDVPEAEGTRYAYSGW